MFCPVCWKEYPKGFIKCDACDIPLTEKKEGDKSEGHVHGEKGSKETPKAGPAKGTKK